MACKILEQQNQTWHARHSNNKIKQVVPDIRTTERNMAYQTFEQLNQTWRARHSNNKIKHDVPDI